MSASDTLKGPQQSMLSGVLPLLRSLGWQELSAREATAHREEDTRDVLLRPILKERLRAINTFEYQGRRYPFSANAIDAACAALQQSGGAETRYANERIWTLLRYGTPVRETVDGGSKSFTIRYVDWDNPENNAYHVVPNFAVSSEAGKFTLDLVLLVNGIPFVVAECKEVVSSGGASRGLDGAIEQLLTYQRERNIPRLFHFAQLLLATAVDDAVYATVGAPRWRWAHWHEREGAPITTDSMLALSDRAKLAKRLPNDNSGTLVKEQERLIHALCRPARLLELTRWFTFFTHHGRHLARHYQYFAVQDVLRRVKKVEPDGSRRGGVIWHTQGTGKSMTMTMLSQVLLDEFKERKPRIVLVTDRVDMDDHIYKTLTASGVECRQAGTGSELLGLLRDPQTRVITTLVHKFDSALRARPIALDDPDVFVLVDEAHRSQSGQLHHAMRRTLPRACFLGFIGGPYFKADRGVLETFGDIISSYSTEQAIADRALLPVRYEARWGKLRTQREHHAWVKDYVAADPSPELEQLYSVHFQELETEDRIREIATDIAQHFKEKFAGTPLKGQLVTTSRRASLQFKRALDKLGITSEVVVSLQNVSSDDSNDFVQHFRHDMLMQFGSEARYESDAIDRFTNTDEPQILIVVNKLLAGFDAPRNSVLYLARPLSSPTLLQAVARINRVYEGKKAGLVVDYVGGVAPCLDEILSGVSGAGIDKSSPARHAVKHPELQQDLMPARLDANAEPALTRFESCCREIVAKQFTKEGVTVSSGTLQQLCARITRAIVTRLKVEWANDIDTQNQMKTAIEDELYAFQADQMTTLGLRTLDAILDSCVKSAVTILPNRQL